MNPYPLGLPKGSVRAILTLILLGVTAAMLFIPVVEGGEEVRAMFVTLTALAVKGYYDERRDAPEPEEERVSIG